jgi:putative Mn2+ efflux pump MntP
MIVGIKMILDARCDEEKCFDPLKLSVILGLAVATSIDAFAVGITFSLIGVTIWEAAAVIGGITFAISLAGTQLGKVLAGHLRNYTEIAGGLLLIAVGIRIVWVRM